jgi:hypothetical protein
MSPPTAYNNNLQQKPETKLKEVGSTQINHEAENRQIRLPWYHFQKGKEREGPGQESTTKLEMNIESTSTNTCHTTHSSTSLYSYPPG